MFYTYLKINNSLSLTDLKPVTANELENYKATLENEYGWVVGKDVELVESEAPKALIAIEPKKELTGDLTYVIAHTSQGSVIHNTCIRAVKSYQTAIANRKSDLARWTSKIEKFEVVRANNLRQVVKHFNGKLLYS